MPLFCSVWLFLSFFFKGVTFQKVTVQISSNTPEKSPNQADDWPSRPNIIKIIHSTCMHACIQRKSVTAISATGLNLFLQHYQT